MNEEAGFHAALDANPEDHGVRLVLADWLQDRDDARAEGYRALVAIGFRPVEVSGISWLGTMRIESLFRNREPFDTYTYRPCLLPDDWFEAVAGEKTTSGYWMEFDTRREAEDAAAIGFAKLPAKRRAELLAVAVLA